MASASGKPRRVSATRAFSAGTRRYVSATPSAANTSGSKRDQGKGRGEADTMGKVREMMSCDGVVRRVFLWWGGACGGNDFEF